MLKPDQIKCPYCNKQITREEMEEEIRTGTLTLVVVNGERLAHKVCD